jgi:ribulose-phosphate 3-epimerase
MAGPDGANARRAVEAGADAIVAGTAIFGAADYAEAIGQVRAARPPAP